MQISAASSHTDCVCERVRLSGNNDIAVGGCRSGPIRVLRGAAKFVLSQRLARDVDRSGFVRARASKLEKVSARRAREMLQMLHDWPSLLRGEYTRVALSLSMHRLAPLPYETVKVK